MKIISITNKNILTYNYEYHQLNSSLCDCPLIKPLQIRPKITDKKRNSNPSCCSKPLELINIHKCMNGIL